MYHEDLQYLCSFRLPLNKVLRRFPCRFGNSEALTDGLEVATELKVCDAGGVPKGEVIADGERSRLLKLAANADLDRSLRKAAEAALIEAASSIDSLAMSKAQAEKARCDVEACLSCAEELFRRERRAWELDALDLETIVARSKEETLIVETSLKEAEERIADLQEELRGATTIKDRAMAFISQRALVTSQEQVMILLNPLPSSLPDCSCSRCCCYYSFPGVDPLIVCL